MFVFLVDVSVLLCGEKQQMPDYQLKVPADLLHRDRRPLRFGLNHLCQVVIPVLFDGYMLSFLVVNFIQKDFKIFFFSCKGYFHSLIDYIRGRQNMFVCRSKVPQSY